MMDMEVKNLYWETMFSVIQRSYSISKHVDFFLWLQTYVNEFIPHDILLTAWGDFSQAGTQSKFNYDVASNVTGINTQAIFETPDEIDSLMRYLHEAWVNNDRRWLTINDLEQQDLNSDSGSIFLHGLKQLNSLLVYGVSDVRGQNECLYVFFSREKIFVVQDFVMGMLMPHIDNALRKIQHLEPAEVNNPEAAISNSELSNRELEIIHWVKSGKTNQEIGLILQISQNTVKSHLKRIFHKLNVSKRAQAVAILSNQ
jgi:transcriptional regulator EpsA